MAALTSYDLLLLFSLLLFFSLGAGSSNLQGTTYAHINQGIL
jgi:hypothetical protein